MRSVYPVRLSVAHQLRRAPIKRRQLRTHANSHLSVPPSQSRQRRRRPASPGWKPNGVKLTNQEGRKAFTTEPTESTEREKWRSSVSLGVLCGLCGEGFVFRCLSFTPLGGNPGNLGVFREKSQSDDARCRGRESPIPEPSSSEQQRRR
jgi:hypothetical protein